MKGALVAAATFPLLCMVSLYRVVQSLRWALRSPTTQKPTDIPPPPEGDPRYRDFFPNRHGLWIYTRRWLPAEAPKGVVYIAHGFGEHISRYDHVASRWVEAGYAVFGMDHQGHGRSHGDRGYVESFDHFVEDFTDFVNRVRSEDGNKWTQCPQFLFGHSMGGCIATYVAHTQPALFRSGGVMLSGPLLGVDSQAAPKIIIKAAGLLSSMFPKLPITKLPVSAVVKDVISNRAYVYDPLVYVGGMRARIGSELLNAAGKIVTTVAPRWTLPIILMHATEDKLTPPKASEDFIETCCSTDKTIHLLPNVFHEFLNEENWMEPCDTFREWMDRHV